MSPVLAVFLAYVLGVLQVCVLIALKDRRERRREDPTMRMARAECEDKLAAFDRAVAESDQKMEEIAKKHGIDWPLGEQG